MRYIKYYNFWGCPNYQDGKRHSTINPKSEYKKVSKDWLTNIISYAGLKGKIKAMNLLNYYTSIGLEDLRVLFEKGGTTEGSINTLPKTNKRSKQQESKCREYLESLYPKVLYQQWIEYKLKSSLKSEKCCPDFICSTDVDVMVCDAKLDPKESDANKMNEYGKLVQWILDQHNDQRLLSISIIHDTEKKIPITKGVNFISI